MSQAVWKYTIELKDVQRLNVPIGTKFLSAQMQEEQLCLWTLVDLNQQHLIEETVLIYVIGTGNNIPINSMHPRLSELDFIDTVQQFDSKAVWHVFKATLVFEQEMILPRNTKNDGKS